MTDVLVPAVVPYARFLEVRARRRQIATELTRSHAGGPTTAAASSAAVPNEQRAAAPADAVAPVPTADRQR